jgi:hypothetical protein
MTENIPLCCCVRRRLCRRRIIHLSAPVVESGELKVEN